MSEQAATDFTRAYRQWIAQRVVLLRLANEYARRRRRKLRRKAWARALRVSILPIIFTLYVLHWPSYFAAFIVGAVWTLAIMELSDRWVQRGKEER